MLFHFMVHFRLVLNIAEHRKNKLGNVPRIHVFIEGLESNYYQFRSWLVLWLSMPLYI